MQGERVRGLAWARQEPALLRRGAQVGPSADMTEAGPRGRVGTEDGLDIGRWGRRVVAPRARGRVLGENERAHSVHELPTCGCSPSGCSVINHIYEVKRKKRKLGGSPSQELGGTDGRWGGEPPGAGTGGV